MASLPSFRLGDDPYGTMFETVSSLTERIKDSLESDFAEVAAARGAHEPRPAQVGAHLLHPP